MKQRIGYINNYWAVSLAAIAFALLVYGCSVKKNKWVNRQYHNTTARFNGYFNGNEAWKEGVALLEKNHVDKFDRIIPVFKFGTVEQSKSIYPQMDKAIKKAETVVTKHSMLIKGKQYNNWVDGSFLLRGKARFYKRDYYAALEDLEYVAKVKPYKKRFTWKYEGLLYLARTYNELGMFSEAESVIDRIKNEKGFPNKNKDRFYAVQADFYLKQGDDSSAIAPLKKAIELTKKKKVRGRYTYILAQIYQRQKDYRHASKLFARVLKLNPSYDLEFNAQLNMARSFDRENGNSKSIRAKLLKMTREDKNIDFLDQIYYALGELAQRDEDEPQAIKDYNTSVKTSRANTNQKGMSYLALGEIQLAHPDYRPAKAYYDSASTLIDRESPLYRGVQDKKKSLTELIENLDVIELEDSLQTLAKLDTTERNKRINAFLDDKEKKEREAKAKAAADLASGNNPQGSTFNPNGNNTNTTGGGNTVQGFYFANQVLRSQGFSDFKRVWGDRTLEDNWRRSNKQSILPVVKEDTATAPKDTLLAQLKGDTTAYKAALRKKEFDAIVSGLPSSPEDFATSTAKVLDAYYNAANIYREQLNDKLHAVEMFEKMLERYPSNNKYELSVYYQLYRVYGMLGNTAKADFYKNKILTGFPDSDYAKLINNPQALTKDASTKKEMEKYYTETFDLYKTKHYAEVVTRCDEALRKFTDKELTPKFAYLRALAVGRTSDVNTFEASLRDVVTNYPLNPVKDEAQYILDYIDKKKSGDSTSIGDNSKSNTDALTMFEMNPDSTQLYALVILNKKVKVNEIKTMVSDFDGEYFGLMDLKIESRFLNDTTQMILVKSFKNKDYATTYFNAVKGDKDALSLLGPTDYTHFIITPENLAIVQKQKSINNYQVYFNDKYKFK